MRISLPLERVNEEFKKEFDISQLSTIQHQEFKPLSFQGEKERRIHDDLFTFDLSTCTLFVFPIYFNYIYMLFFHLS